MKKKSLNRIVLVVLTCLLSIFISCTPAEENSVASGDSSENGNENNSGSTAPSSAPHTLSLSSPALSPGLDPTPTISVGGVESGLTVTLFSDSSCSTSLGSATASGTSVNIDLSLTPGTYEIYAQSSNEAGNSPCSTDSVSYTLSSCPTGYIPIPANPDVGTDRDFCVMKYEAKSGGVSQAAGNPWVSINATTAFDTCAGLSGGNFALISNQEWMTIARNIEAEASNWSTGTVGEGFINRGHSDNSPSSALAASTDDNPYFGTGNTSGNQKRTHVLSNGEVIWDLSGNVTEWVDWDKEASHFNDGPKTCTDSWMDFPSVTCSSPFPFLDMDYLPLTPSGDSSIGLGKLIGGTGGAARRGASWLGGQAAGVFSLYLYGSSTSTLTSIGFRCVWRPPVL